MAKKKIGDIVAEELQPFLKEEGLELFRTEFVKEGKDWFLRIYIERAWEEGQDTPPPIDTDQCERTSRFLSARLDELDPIQQAYYLEVSSPGIDRPLLSDKDFSRFKGRLIEVSLYQAMDGKKTFQGHLQGLNDGNIVLKDEKGQEVLIPQEKASKTKLAFVF